MQIAFFILSFISVFAAINVIFSEKPIVSGLYLLLCFTSVAGLYVTLSAPFIAAMQLIVYSGAIVVLILFVIMLLNQHKEGQGNGSNNFVKFVSSLFAIAIGVFMYLGLTNSKIIASYKEMSTIGGMENNVEQLAVVLFSKYFVPFEVISLLLLAAIIAAVFLSRKKV
jgi:NADH-quinone oxidoreductase subunit J